MFAFFLGGKNAWKYEFHIRSVLGSITIVIRTERIHTAKFFSLITRTNEKNANQKKIFFFRFRFHS